MYYTLWTQKVKQSTLLSLFLSIVYFVERLFFHTVLRVNLINFLLIASYNLIVLELHF